MTTITHSSFPLTFTYRGQSVGAVLRPADSVWDAFQTRTTLDAQGRDSARGDFIVGDLRIFAEDLIVAKMLARRLQPSSGGDE